MSSHSRVDMHVKVLDEGVVDRAKARGLDALVYAPHYTRWPTIRETAAAHSDEELTVVPGREIFTGSWRRRRHVLALDLETPIPDFVTLAGAMEALRRQDAVVLVPHPTFLSMSLTEREIRAYREVIRAVERENGKFLPRHRRRAADICARLDVPAFGSSYAHLGRTVGEIWTTFEASIERPADLHGALREGAPRRIGGRTGPGHALSRGLEWSHLFWENTWKKFDRVVLGDREATHPGHPAYAGRFDDVRVDRPAPGGEPVRERELAP